MNEDIDPKVSRSIERRRFERDKLLGQPESISPTEALKMAEQIVKEYEMNRFNEYNKLKPGGESPMNQFNLMQELDDIRTRKWSLTRAEIFHALALYNKSDGKIITPPLLVCAEECIRRFSTVPPPKLHQR